MPKHGRKRKPYTRTKPYKVPLTTLCWLCANATNEGCSWSKSFTPVEGWEATPTTIQGGYNAKLRLENGKIVQTSVEREIPSYKVHSCPEFIQDVESTHLGLPRLNKK